jgi:hypothetical protein
MWEDEKMKINNLRDLLARLQIGSKLHRGTVSVN